ncbi:MAG TPA: hypothetical protein VFZ61_04070, partial [Polyangiales bacterium]
LSAELRQSVEELLARVWQRVGRLYLRVEPKDSRVLVDGVEPRRHGEELVLASGAHRVEISAAGRTPYALALETRPGSRDSLHAVLALVPDPAPTAALPSPAMPPTPAPRDASRSPSLARNSLLIGGGALLVAGAASWATGFARYRDLVDECREDGQSGCEEDLAKQRYDQERIGPLTTTGAVLLSVGAAALLTAGALELWRFQRRRTHTAARARLLLRGAGVGVHASF